MNQVDKAEMAHTRQYGALKGKTVAITGRLNNLTNNEAREVVEREGGTPSQDISEHTDVIIVGENPGEELLRAANQNQVKKVDEDGFIELLKGA